MVSRYVALALVLGVTLAQAQGKMPVQISDEIRYKEQSYYGEFALYEREGVETAPDTGLPSKYWYEESVMAVRADGADPLGPEDEALALRLAEAFCRHYGLDLLAPPGNAVYYDGEWEFYNLCWQEGW